MRRSGSVSGDLTLAAGVRAKSSDSKRAESFSEIIWVIKFGRGGPYAVLATSYALKVTPQAMMNRKAARQEIQLKLIERSEFSRDHRPLVSEIPNPHSAPENVR